MTTAAEGRASRPALPVITVERFEKATTLLEVLVEQTADVFLAAQQRYRERHAEFHPVRQPNAQEAAQLAVALLTEDEDPVALAEQIQGSELRVQDRPDAREMLAVAGASTAPALVRVGARLYTLLRMEPAAFKQACEDDRLDEAIDDEYRATVADMPMDQARECATEALAHFLNAAGAGGAEGNPWGLVAKVIRQALEMALGTMGPGLDRLTSSSLIDSPPSTGGPSSTSSTSSPTGER